MCCLGPLGLSNAFAGTGAEAWQRASGINYVINYVMGAAPQPWLLIASCCSPLFCSAAGGAGSPKARVQC